MCGIAGWVSRRAAGIEALQPVLRSMAHRGPDDEGAYRFDSPSSGWHALLGHRRLAIIDPAGARQPMCDERAGLALVFNGEIYNFRELREELREHGHVFARDSDTEVLLRAYQQWGEGCVRRLRGMFAVAVWDERAERLFLARDRFGEKPLFLCEDARGVWFASEIKALLAAGVRAAVELRSVWDYLAYRYVPGPRTLFQDIRKLQPGTCAIWQGGRLTERRYWSAPDRRERAPGRAAGDAVDAFLERLDDAVAGQMVSDVPFGAYLSGGLDSSTIVALMARHSAMVKTFSVGFTEDRYSELAYAGEVARHFGTDHHELVVDSRDLMRHLPTLIAFRDAPVSEPSDIPIYMLAREAARSVKMVLSGEGSDEILGGYPKHVVERFAGGYQVLPAKLRRGLIAPLARSLPYAFRRVKTAVANLNLDDWRERSVRWFGALDHEERERLSVLHLNGSDVPSLPPFDSDPGNSALRRMLYFDQASWLPDNLLERGDRMNMAASIEARVPFLDHRLAEYVSALPDRMRVRGLRTKWILREAVKQLLPERILKRRKVGFRVPVNEWFRGEMRAYLVEHLKSSASITRVYYDAGELERVLSEHFEGRQNHEKLLWTLLNLELWHRRYAS